MYLTFTIRPNADLMPLWSFCLSEAHSLADSQEEVMGTILSEFLHVVNSLSLL